MVAHTAATKIRLLLLLLRLLLLLLRRLLRLLLLLLPLSLCPDVSECSLAAGTALLQL